MADILDQITSSGLCHGCGACAAALGGKVAMRMTEDGYLRPKTAGPLTRAEAETVSRVCSGLSLERTADTVAAYHSVWGPVISVGTGYATDPEVRYRGSSGGVISAISIYLIETGAVDFVLQTAASAEDPVSNTSRISESRLSVVAAAGSRYAPSAPLANIEDYLAAGRRFAFVGKPCDVASLRRMARHDPRIDVLVPIKLAFFCAGVPSRKGAMAVIDRLGVAETDLTEFSYRGRGWPGLTRAVRKDGTEASMDYNSSWGTILNKHLQFRCKICPDGTGEAADISCADAWYGKDGYPDFTEQDGRSLIVARTAKGAELLRVMSDAGAVVREDLDIDEIRRMQPYQFDRKRAVLVRVAALVLRGRLHPKFRRLDLIKLSLLSSPVWLLRNFWGTYRRMSIREKIF